MDSNLIKLCFTIRCEALTPYIKFSVEKFNN